MAGALTKISVSLINNSKFDIVSYVIRKMAEAASEWIENELINGTASKIDGLSKVDPAVTAASATAITADELIDLQESIPDKLQAKCIWVMGRATRKAIRKLKDSEGNYLLNRDMTAKWGYTLLGRDMRAYRKELQDNDCGAWSEAARQWAIENGIIAGGGIGPDGQPNYMWADTLTREQAVMLLYRFAQFMGKA